MIAVIQRVKNASVTIERKLHSEIGVGLLVLLGIGQDDTQEDIDWLAKKIVQMRIFSDSEQKMNLSVQDVGGNILLVSQFTLFASTKKGNRPSFIEAARPEIAIPLYEKSIAIFSQELGKSIQTGEFGADMQVNLLNDGPVTIIIDSKNRK
ncbi:D-tyrosyl-tRNA(Tyr) deacylase [bacterium 336/3]|nr:D-tyrosyl-tRNA(Tyr) deacylase [bacterium 336/3]